jgi:single-strand DNA-binding protein
MEWQAGRYGKTECRLIRPYLIRRIMSTPITLIGNATADAELAFSANGDARASFTLAVNERLKKGDDWVDGEPVFYRITAWRSIAEAVAERVLKGTRLVVIGKFKPREYETKQGEKRMSLDVTADTVALVVKPAGDTRRQQPSRVAESDPWSNEPVPF